MALHYCCITVTLPLHAGWAMAEPELETLELQDQEGWHLVFRQVPEPVTLGDRACNPR